MRLDLGAQRIELLAEQCPHDHWLENQIHKELRGRCELLRREGRQSASPVRLRYLAQQAPDSLLAASARHAMDAVCQIWKPMRFGNPHTHQIDRVTSQGPMQQRRT